MTAVERGNVVRFFRAIAADDLAAQLDIRFMLDSGVTQCTFAELCAVAADLVEEATE